MKKNYAIIILSIVGYYASAQLPVLKNRIEFELTSNLEEKEIIPVGSEGFIVCSKSKSTEERKVEWKLSKYNTDMAFLSSVSFFSDSKFKRAIVSNTSLHTHQLFTDKDGAFRLTTVNFNSMEATEVSGHFMKGIELGKMKVMGDLAYFPAAINKVSFLIMLDWKTGKITDIPIEIEGDSEASYGITSMDIMESTEEIFVHVLGGSPLKNYTLQLNSLGRTKGQIFFDVPHGKALVTVSAKMVAPDYYLFTGNYSNGIMPYPNGFYIAEVRNEKVGLINYYEYYEQKDFFAHIQATDKTKELYVKKVENGKASEIPLRYYVVPHELIETSGGYLFIGEVCFPEYLEYIDAQGRSMKIFDGYRYTHAVLAMFTKGGNLIWSKCTEMWSTNLPQFPIKLISVHKDESSLNLLMPSRESILFSSVNLNGNISIERKVIEIKSLFEGDRTENTSSNACFWYGNCFLISGKEIIKNKSNKNIKKKRSVFYTAKYEIG